MREGDIDQCLSWQGIVGCVTQQRCTESHTKDQCYKFKVAESSPHLAKSNNTYPIASYARSKA